MGDPGGDYYAVPVRCSGRTGVLFNSKPVAFRMAARTAGVDDRVGASPTPRSPYGAWSSASSSTSTGMVGVSRIVGMR